MFAYVSDRRKAVLSKLSSRGFRAKFHIVVLVASSVKTNDPLPKQLPLKLEHPCSRSVSAYFRFGFSFSVFLLICSPIL